MPASPLSLKCPAEIADYLVSVLEASEHTPYIGEPISQLQHSLQCAWLAAASKADEATQVAALLHDVGQFAPASHLRGSQGHAAGLANLGDKASHESVGRAGHETLGARFLQRLGFSAKVVRLVESHVAAKRYLCAVDAAYHDTLSDASKLSLRYQGGRMTPAEQEAFARSPWCADMCRLRRWDDEAKLVGLDAGTADAWRDALARQLTAHHGDVDAATCSEAWGREEGQDGGEVRQGNVQEMKKK